jgi:cell division protein FtsB
MAVILIALVVNCLLGPEGPLDLIMLANRRAKLTVQNAQLASENAKLEQEKARLQFDPVCIRKMIRKELGYSRPDEFVYRFRSDESPQ